MSNHANEDAHLNAERIFVDLTPALQAAAGRLQDDDLLYYPANVHYTTSGHRVVAEALAPVLTELRDAPPTARDGGRTTGKAQTSLSDAVQR